MEGRKMSIKNGKHTSFWYNIWFGDKALCIQYPELYELCLNQTSLVYEVVNMNWAMRFKIILPPSLRD